MTDPTPTRAGYSVHVEDYADMLRSLSAENQALRERAEAAERRAYELAVAIMGGEDAPGYADSIPTQVLVDQQREMALEWLHRVTPAAARRAEAAAWNDAIEAVAEKCDVAPMDHIGDIVRGIGDEIRALRRAVPTEGEA